MTGLSATPLQEVPAVLASAPISTDLNLKVFAFMSVVNRSRFLPDFGSIPGPYNYQYNY
jgi:hypothetical protein